MTPDERRFARTLLIALAVIAVVAILAAFALGPDDLGVAAP